MILHSADTCSRNSDTFMIVSARDSAEDVAYRKWMEQTGKTLWLSPTDFETTFGVSLPSYKTARKNLENKRFLRKEKGNLLVFDSLPED